jgi:hypothetical protein
VLPLTAGIRDSAVQLVSILGGVVHLSTSRARLLFPAGVQLGCVCVWGVCYHAAVQHELACGSHLPGGGGGVQRAQPRVVLRVQVASRVRQSLRRQHPAERVTAAWWYSRMMMQTWRIVALGVSGGRSLTRPFRDAR